MPAHPFAPVLLLPVTLGWLAACQRSTLCSARGVELADGAGCTLYWRDCDDHQTYAIECKSTANGYACRCVCGQQGGPWFQHADLCRRPETLTTRGFSSSATDLCGWNLKP